jgi:glycosyltransferase involved in cell wall biosynthesis
MRILYLTEEPITFSGSMVRGGQIHVRNVVTGLRDRGHDVHLLDWNPTPERSFQHSLSPRFRFVVDPARTFYRAVSVGRDFSPDVIVSKTRKTYLPGYFAAKLLGVPHVVHVGSRPGSPGLDVFDRLDTLSVKGRLRVPHDGYFVVCDAIGDDLQELGIPRNRIYDVKNAVDTDRFHPKRIPVSLEERFAKRIDSLQEDRLIVGYVGGLQPYKGLDDLARALEQTETEWHLLVAGDGPERERLERKMGDHATFLGSVPYDQVPALCHEFDILVLPSHTEGLPRVILEAQATATPVVATRVGGVPEVVEDGRTGLLCDARNPDCFAAAIDRLAADDTERSRLAEMGREAVATSFTWDSLYDRYERFLQTICG